MFLKIKNELSTCTFNFSFVVYYKYCRKTKKLIIQAFASKNNKYPIKYPFKIEEFSLWSDSRRVTFEGKKGEKREGVEYVYNLEYVQSITTSDDGDDTHWVDVLGKSKRYDHITRPVIRDGEKIISLE